MALDLDRAAAFAAGLQQAHGRTPLIHLQVDTTDLPALPQHGNSHPGRHLETNLRSAKRAACRHREGDPASYQAARNQRPQSNLFALQTEFQARRAQHVLHSLFE